MKYIIHPNDIPVLAKIFQPNTKHIFVLTSSEELDFYQNIPDKLACKVQLFDKLILLLKAMERKLLDNIVLLNISDRAIPQKTIPKDSNLVIIDFSGKKSNTTFGQLFQFNYINNPDKTIRWIYDKQLNKPVFLNLYNASGIKGRLIQRFFKIGYKCRVKKWLNSGSFQVFANQLFLEEVDSQLKQAKYAIFTGTIGENRKAVVSYEESKKNTKFLKFPLTKPAQKLIEKETQSLEELNQFSFKYLAVPVPKRVDNGLLLTNVRPVNPLINSDLTRMHLTALYELYNRTSIVTSLSDTVVWQEIQENLALIEKREINNNLAPKKVNKLTNVLSKLARQFSPHEVIVMSTAHGDLTPWNSYLSKDQLHVYDWELTRKLPLFYDAFHYIFQTNVLVKRRPFEVIKQEIDALKNHPIIQSILVDYKVDFEQAYQFYLLRNVSYYLSRYMQQPQLHEQAHWLVDIWLESIESCLKEPISAHLFRPFITYKV